MPSAPSQSLFLILGRDNFEKIEAEIKTKYPNDYYQLGDGQWIIASAGETTRGVCDQLGITTARTGNAVVVAFTNYFGRANKEIWEWMAAKLGAQNA